MQLETNSAAGLYGICMRCNERVLGPMDGMRAMDQLFHVACFSCFACGMSLQSQEFYAMDGNAYCENCYMVIMRVILTCLIFNIYGSRINWSDVRHVTSRLLIE